jgi:hypothetical protein
VLNDSYYFETLAIALNDSLFHLGVNCSVSSTIDKTNALYVIFTTHIRTKFPAHFVCYNLEQLTTDRVWSQALFERFRAAVFILDFSQRNVNLLRARGIPALHAPLGYHPAMEATRPHPPDERKFDVCFAGALTSPRREASLMPFRHASGLVFRATQSSFGSKLIEMYLQCRIALNIHYYQGMQLLEVHRIIPLVVMKVWVVTEHSDDPWLDDSMKDLVTFSSRELLLNTTLHTLKRTDFSTVVESRYQRIKMCCRFTAHLTDSLSQSVRYFPNTKGNLP